MFEQTCTEFCFILISIPAFFKFEFIKFGLSYPERLFIIWLATSVFKSKFSTINFNFNSISQNSHR